MKVSNQGCIRRLSLRFLLASRTRNIVAVLAIALTAVLFTSLFTIALSINEGIQENAFRQAGGWAHGTFKSLSKEQFDALKGDPLIKEWGVRRFLGMPEEAPFHKSHVEISYCDEKEAHFIYCDPVEGRLPKENTNEAATDTRVLKLLGITPKVGEQFTVTFLVDGHETTQTFTLCGWWEYDEAITASHILIPESRVEAVLQETGVTPPGEDQLTGGYSLDVMLKNGSRSIESDMVKILEDHGYEEGHRGQGGNWIAIGVNWGYTGAQLSNKLDSTTAVVLVAMLILILLTGYLIIYNVFQISVAGDIHFYGLLKTIGTTPRQLRRIIRIQALILSLMGIPIGLVLGWLLGGVLTPLVAARLNGVTEMVSVSPVLFAASAAFALVTVFISCRRPGKVAGKVSPVEAVRYTDGKVSRSKEKKGDGKVSLLSMAWANLGRNRGKTAVTMLSLALAVVLLTMTVTFAGSFDMEKFISGFTASDFIVADGGKFQSTDDFSEETAVPEEVIDAIDAQGGITESGRIYGKVTPVEEFVTEDYYRSVQSQWNSQEQIDSMIGYMERTPEGLLADRAQLYGMESFALDHLTVLEGDLSALSQPDSYAMAAVYSEDDYGKAEENSHWAKLGDKVTLRYVERYEYYDPITGQVYEKLEDVPNEVNCIARAVEYRDVEYTVAALVTVPNAFSYRYFGADEFVLGADAFVRDTGTRCVMYYAFDTTKKSNASMESFLQDYTENQNPKLDYESKSTYAGEFENVRRMFLILGGALSFVVGLVGVLNFFNAILTGIAARRRELAVLQSIGMTTRQMQILLSLEGLLYTLGAAVLATVLVLIAVPFLSRTLNHMLWFFTYRFTVWPILMILPLFAVMGVAIPLFSGRAARRRSVVDRLRQE